MGKVDLAFDHTQNKNDINELSVVVYTDSFFYGLWGANQTLVKVGYHPHASLGGLLKLWDYNYKFDQVNLLSAVKPYVHLDNEDVDELYFDIYFKGLYNVSRSKSHFRKIDAFKKESISTLHFLNKKVKARFDDHLIDYKTSHISTAMANYCQDQSAKMICFISNNKLHIAVHQNGFRFYNQFDCYYDHDYLYFMLLIMKEFGLNPRVDTVNIGGDLTMETELYTLLRTHVRNFDFVENKIQISQELDAYKSNFYDLYLCKACV